MVLFLASELMFFGGLFAAYFTLRSIAATWPPPDVHLDMGMTLAATAVLIASSGTMHLGVARFRRGDTPGLRRWLGITFLLGAIFLLIKAYELSATGFGIASHAYGSLFFTMLGAHGVHLGVGLVLLAVVGATAVSRRSLPRCEAVAYYWHFVDGVWLAIFATIYLIR
ncbi:MAG TPA: heme-copper oxidase subunit III [Actinomycetota bacterium]|nr:heme-copper oxidase subunit III [Actinomycetota bacterium]